MSEDVFRHRGAAGAVSGERASHAPAKAASLRASGVAGGEAAAASDALKHTYLGATHASVWLE
jgi:hypothetical protein